MRGSLFTSGKIRDLSEHLDGQVKMALHMAVVGSVAWKRKSKCAKMC